MAVAFAYPERWGSISVSSGSTLPGNSSTTCVGSRQMCHCDIFGSVPKKPSVAVRSFPAEFDICFKPPVKLKRKGSSETKDQGFSAARLSQARQVLRHSRELALSSARLCTANLSPLAFRFGDPERAAGRIIFNKLPPFSKVSRLETLRGLLRPLLAKPI
jgi:hypothetical protein